MTKKKDCPLLILSGTLLIALAVLGLVMPDRVSSPLENRELQSLPQSLDGIDQSFESYLSDQFPFRDGIVMTDGVLRRAAGKQLGHDVVFGENGRVFLRTDAWSEKLVRRNRGAFDDICEASGVPGVFLTVPSAAYVQADELPLGAPNADEEALLRVADGIALKPAQPGQSLFYKTDHHWNADGVYEGYLLLCGALGIKPYEKPQTAVYPGFLGTLYARSPGLLIKSEDLVFYEPKTEIKLLIDGKGQAGLYDAEQIKERDKYAALLYGNHARCELINESAPSGTLFMIRDSYANALLPLLAQHYRHIIAVDPRYYQDNVVSDIKENGAEVIVCVNGLSTLATAGNIYLLQGF